MPSGQPVEAWTLIGRGGLTLEVMTLGGIVTKLLAPARDGALRDVVLGFDDLHSYLAGHPYFGAITGRVAGRITNATFALDGHTYQLARNDPPHHLHGGATGFDKRVWNASPVKRVDGAPSLRLTYFSPEGEEGYPGNVHAAVTYTVTHDNVFLIETAVDADRVTPLNLTHHSYFNLAGEGSGTIAGHRLAIFADTFFPADEHMALTGRMESTARYGNDFQRPRWLGEAIPLLYRNHGDLYSLPVNGTQRMRPVAWLEDPASGRVLTVLTTERTLQLYTGSGLDGSLKGKSGTAYARHAGVCLECQGFPDVANMALRKEILIRPGETRRNATAYAFSINRLRDASPQKA